MMNGFKKGVLRMVAVAVLSIIWPMLAMSAKVNLPKTGQTTCYNATGEVIDCAGTGQDGDIQAGVEWPNPRFGDNGDGTMTDHLTGLVWLKDAGCAEEMNWDDAVNFCNTLANDQCGLSDESVAGDWRLPNIIELESLLNAGVLKSSTWLNSKGFANVISSYYWSATTCAGSASEAWIVCMSSSCMYYGYLSSEYKTAEIADLFLVWPVRTGQTDPATTWQTGQKTSYASGDDGDFEAGVAWPSPRFTDNVNGTVTDHLTGLIWLENANCAGYMAWNQALNFCNTLASGSYGLSDGSASGGWRLPNSKEILSLIDFSQHYPALPQGHPFSNVQSSYSYYWSATTGVSFTSIAWIFTMAAGYVNIGDKVIDDHYVWPVRAGQLGGPLGHLTISYPNGGETLSQGQEYTITWSSENITGPIQIDLYKGGPVTAHLVLQIDDATEDDGQYEFSPLDSLEDGDDYYIGISSDNGTVSDLSDGPFSIAIDPNDIDDDEDGFTGNEGDCDDNNPAVHPGAKEIRDRIDNNCDGVVCFISSLK